MESVRPPSDELKLGDVPGDYVVVLPNGSNVLPLPAWTLMWTSTAYVLWDDLDPGTLSGDQRRALLDWLHWGGQIIVSGPKSLEVLQRSFLGDYLPAEAGPTQVVLPAQVDELNTSWSVPSKDRQIDTTLVIKGDAQLEAIELTLRPEGQFVAGTGQLVAERRIGRGRIAVAAFSLARRELTNWRSFDNFFNACLLRRPARRFLHSVDTGVTCQWTDAVMRALEGHPAGASDPILRALGEEDANLSIDEEFELSSQGHRQPNESLITTQLRYFSRDAATATGRDQDAIDEVDTLEITGYQCDAQAGVAGWNDFSECSQLARDSLTSAAGISVPDRSLIIWALGLYLFVLVPANWTIFRAVGRVEWAWAAVPLIALLGTVAVVRLAQLDIGFARSRTEIAIVETQPLYTRAHVTRYIGLYTSLSTDYQLSFADDSAVAAPLASRQGQLAMVRSAPKTVVLARTSKRAANVQLQGLAVNSNSTEMVHSEQMLDLGVPYSYMSVPVV